MLRLSLTLMLVSVLGASLLADGANIRLAGGSHSCSGRVEVYYNNTWGTVCDDDWDMNDAQVVCKQLGCGDAVNTHESAYFGQGSGPIWLDDIQCFENERTITQCSHSEFGKHDCGHGEDAGVTCLASLALYIGVGVTAGLLLLLVPIIIFFVKKQKRRKCQVNKKKDSQRPKNTYETHHEENETDDEADHENAETIFQQRDHSDDSDNDYVDIDADEQRSDVDNDYENVEIYANYAEN